MTVQVHYDKKAIIKDYQKGRNLRELHEKYGIDISYCWRIIKKAKVLRTASEGHLLANSGQVEWHKLVLVHHSPTRLISIPASVLGRLGVDVRKPLEAKWVVEGKELTLKVRQA